MQGYAKPIVLFGEVALHSLPQRLSDIVLARLNPPGAAYETE